MHPPFWISELQLVLSHIRVQFPQYLRPDHRYKLNLDCLLRRFTAQHRWWEFAAPILKTGATNWLTKLIMYLIRSGENTPLYVHPQHGPSLQVFTSGFFPLVHAWSFSYNAAIFSTSRCETTKIRLFSDWHLQFAKACNFKTIIVYTWPSVITTYMSPWRVTLGSRFSCPPANVLCQSPVPVFFLLLFIHLELSNGA